MKYTTLQDELTDGSDEELEERNLKLKTLERSKPAVLRMKNDIDVSKGQCLDCKAFQERVKETSGIDFNIIFLLLDTPSKSRKSQVGVQFVNKQ
jgi:hypothetical protein